MQYDVSISTKGQLVLPKEIRDKFKLNSGSKMRITVEQGKIVLQPRTLENELYDIIISSIVKDGKQVTKETFEEYQAKFRIAIDTIAAEADEAYVRKEYISLAELKREAGNV